MTDVELVRKKLARIETCVTELRTLITPAEISQDLKSERFAEHTLQIAIQCAIDIALHIVAEDRLGEPDSAHSVFDLLLRNGWIDADLRQRLTRMVGFRNRLVHEYESVDPRVVQAVVADRLGDFEAFVRAIRERI